MENKRKILFVNDEMHMGGVARVLITLMKALLKENYEVDLLVLHKEGMLLKEIPEEVTVIEGTPFFNTVDLSLQSLLKEKKMDGILSKTRLLLYMKTGLIKKKIQEERKNILHKKYDVEVAAKEGFCTIFTAYGDSTKKINWVLTDYSVKNYSSNHMKLVKQALSKIDMNIADSEQALIAYKTVFKVSNGVVIHNLMDIETIKKGMEEETEIKKSEVPNLISVARFHPQKAIMRLLIASLEATKHNLKHNLYLIGGGEEEKELKNYVKDNHMDYVYFLGYKQNPYADMKQSDLFVLSSLYEGFATVINESLITGTPVLTTDVSGAREQIVNPDCGWIVENTQEGLNRGLIHALENFENLKKKKENLQQYHYDNEMILKQFIENL